MIKDMQGRIGEKLGSSPWLTITQEQIDEFASASRDPDPMHIDPEWAAKHGPFGRTVSFGFLTMSLLTHMHHEVMQHSKMGGEAGFGLNYGFNRLRLICPVPVGSRVRGHFGIKSIEQRRDDQYLLEFDVSIEIESENKPALIGEWLVMWVGEHRFDG
jgi:acyl dehydratase